MASSKAFLTPSFQSPLLLDQSTYSVSTLTQCPVPDTKHFVAAHVPWLQRSGKHKGTMVPAGAPVAVIGATTVQCSRVSIQPLASSSAGAVPHPVSSSSRIPACFAGQTGNLCGIDCFVHI